MEDIGTQRGGLVFVYNMYGSKYANFDYDLSQKMLTLLKGLFYVLQFIINIIVDNGYMEKHIVLSIYP